MIVNSQFAVIRSPTDQGAVVARFDGGDSGQVRIPDEIANHEGFAIQEFDNRQPFNNVGPDTDYGVNQSGISDAEAEILKRNGYPDIR